MAYGEGDSKSALGFELEKPGRARQGTLTGTINYMAPDMIKSQVTTMTTDLWALGIIMFKMITGKVPFRGTTEFEVFPQVLKGTLPWPTDM